MLKNHKTVLSKPQENFDKKEIADFMKNKTKIFYILTFALLIMASSAIQTLAQPSDAQLKKQLTSPKTVSVTLNGKGSIEWSKTYKKYVWSRYFTAKLKTDTPGEFLIVKGYASYDVMGGRYVFWRTFTSSNSYEGRKNPTAAEINKALETAQLADFNFNDQVIGEYEMMKIAAEPEWEWHTQNSASFNVVAVYRIHNGGGRYYGENYYKAPVGFEEIDKVESYLRIRLYRKSANEPWTGVHVSNRIPTSPGAQTIDEKIRLLEHKNYPAAEFRQMPKMSVIPQLTQ